MLPTQLKKVVVFLTLSTFSSILFSTFYPIFSHYCITQLSLSTFSFPLIHHFLSSFSHYFSPLFLTSLSISASQFTQLYFLSPLLTRLSLSIFSSHYLPISALVYLSTLSILLEIDYPISILHVNFCHPLIFVTTRFIGAYWIFFSFSYYFELSYWHPIRPHFGGKPFIHV